MPTLSVPIGVHPKGQKMLIQELKVQVFVTYVLAGKVSIGKI